MGRSPCCDKVGLKKGPWTPEEDQKLLAYIEEHGHGNWRALPSKAGLQRCGKSCRLRWTNYLRPDIKRGKFSLQEEQTIIQLHALLGNRWSAIATHLPKRTDNEIKNYWNTHLKKRLTKMGIDPITHKPKNDALLTNDGQTNKNASNLSHMAQWESARLEAEARLVRQSKLIPTTVSNTTATAPHHQLVLNNTNNILHGNLATTHPSSSAAQTPRCIDQNPALRAWHGSGTYPKTISTSHDHPNSSGVGASGGGAVGAPHAIESPTSTLSFSENGAPINNPGAAAGSRTGAAAGAAGMIEFMADSTNTNSNNDTTAGDGGLIKEEGSQEFEWKTTFGNNNISSAPHQLAPPSDDHYSDVVENSLYSSGLHDMTLPAVMETPTWAAAAATTRAAAADGDCIIGSSSNTNTTTTTNNNNNHHHSVGNFIENFTELLLSNSVDTSLSNSDGTAGGGGMGVSVGRASHDDDGGVNRGGDAGGSGVSCGDFYEDNKNYWNSILNLVNSSPSSSPLF